jgi:hypothetical protein
LLVTFHVDVPSWLRWIDRWIVIHVDRVKRLVVGVPALDFQQIQEGQQIRVLDLSTFGAVNS